MRKRPAILALLIASALTVSAIIIGLYYLSRTDVGCRIDTDAKGVQACYSLDLLGIIPIGRVQYSATTRPKDGTVLTTLTLDPVGIAQRFTDGDHFEVTSTLDARSYIPREFAISQYDRKGLRSTKTTRYDFSEGMLRWSGHSPPERNKEHVNAEIPFTETVHTPLSAIHNMLDSIRNNGFGDLELVIQVKKYPYTVRADLAELRESSTGEGRTGEVVKIPVAIASSRELREEWRRQKAAKVRLYFTRPYGGPSLGVLLPFKVGLPLHLAAFNLIETGPTTR